MKVARLTGLREFEIREEVAPKLERPRDVLVRIDRVGVCGSDVHYYTAGRIGRQAVEYPATVGHECAGTIAEIGSAVEGLQPGNRVVVDPAVVCGVCDQCRVGRSNTCRNIQFMGCPGQAPGAMAEFRVLPHENCFVIPESVSLDQAALVEPLTIGLYAVGLGRVGPSDRVVLFGGGPIGLAVLLCLKAAGPVHVFLTDLLDTRLEVARTCGADWTGSPTREDVVAAIGEQEPLGVDVAFECSGDPACIEQAIQLLRPGGTLVQVGIPATPRVELDLHAMRTKELTLRNVRRQEGCIGPAIGMIAQGQIDLDPLITHRFPLDRLAEAFELVAAYRDGVIKALVDLSAAQ